MDVKDIYEKTGGDYCDVVKRMGSEAMVAHFVVRFLSDDSMRELNDSFTVSDVERAFRSAHTLKGVALNLGFTELGKNAAALTEILRKNSFDGAAPLFDKTRSAYDELISAIKEYSDKQAEK